MSSPLPGPSEVRPDKTAVVLYGLAIGIALLVGFVTRADPDLWGHVRFGQVMFLTHELPQIDPYAFTSDRPWINHEWLAELAMGTAFEWAGVQGLAILKVALVLASLVVVAGSIERTTSGRVAGAGLFALIALIGVLPLFSTFRPQSFSVALFAIQCAILAARSPVLWTMPPLFALWANLHGGWVMGLGVFGAWLAVHLAQPQPVSARINGVAVGIATVLATLLTPYGLGLWTFMLETIGLERADIREWQPIARLPTLIVPWVLTVVLGLWVVVKKRAHLPAVAACAVLAVLSYRVGRTGPFFSLATGVLLMPGLLSGAAASSRARLLPAVAAAVALAGAAVVYQARAVCWPPSSALQLDPQAHAFIRANALAGRLVVWFDWGQYVIWHFPQLTVSTDGRRETVYSERTRVNHRAMYRGGPAARAYLDALAPDYVWLPNGLPVSGSMATWGWRAIFNSEVSTIWTRRMESYLEAGPIVPACFPGP